MKKIILMILIVLLVAPVNISGAANATATGPRNLIVGGTGSIGLSTSEVSNMTGTIHNSNPSVIQIKNSGLQHNNGNFALDSGQSIPIVAVGVGSTTITFSGIGAEELSGLPFQIKTSITITVNDNNSKPDPKPTPTPTPKPPVKDDTESEKDRIAREQEQKRIDEENKVKAEEERIIKEKEALAKVPLFNEISITSQSDKLKDEVIKSITIEEGVVEYEYSLPRKVNKVSIAIPETEGVTLTYDKEVSFGEDEESKVVSIKAVKEDIEQSYTIKINQDITPDVSKEVNGKNLTVHQDERVSEYFKTLGFETVLPEDATVGNVFENENVKFQLLVNENNEGKYYQLDEAYSIQGEVQLSLSAEEEVFLQLHRARGCDPQRGALLHQLGYPSGRRRHTDRSN